jgi:NitT/TauT family transport system substrate-binding protein
MRRLWAFVGMLGLWALTGLAAEAEDLGTLRIGVLQFGTVSWELDVVRQHGLDSKHGFTLEVQPFGQNEAADVALMGGAVDGIVEDWLWVSRQRADGELLTFLPYSSAVGALMVRPDRGIADVAGLAGKRIGIAGGPLDKSWLILQGYAQAKHGMDLKTAVEPVYGAPPLLSEKLRSGELDAVLSYWHFCARLEVDGFPQLIGVNEAQGALGVPATTPQLGYVFRQGFADSHADLLRAFAAASREAKGILATSDAEWERLRPLTRAESDAVLAALQRRFVAGIMPHWGPTEQAQAAELYLILAKLGGEQLVGKSPALVDGTFWPGVGF